MTRMLLVAEGVTDAGWRIYDEKAGKYVRHDGVLQVLIKKCIDDSEHEIVCALRNDLKDVPLIRKGLSKEEFKRERLAGYAKMRECDSIAYHMDVDKCEFDERYSQIDELLSTAREKGIKCMPIAPMKMLESWLLADEDSFPSCPKKPKLPKKPEIVWGAKDDPDSNFPKHYLKRVLEQFNLEPHRENYVELAKEASVKVLRQKCPVSFQRFYDDLQDLISNDFETTGADQIDAL